MLCCKSRCSLALELVVVSAVLSLCIRCRPPALRQLETDLAACFSPVAQHVSAGFQLHSCTSLDETTSDTLGGTQPAYEFMQLEQPSPAPSQPTPVGDGPQRGTAPLATANGPLLIAALQKQDSVLATEHGVQLALFRWRWALQDAESPTWEVCVLGGCDHALLHAAFYKHDHLALLHAAPQGGTTLALCSTSAIEYAPMWPVETGGIGNGNGAVASVLARLLRMLQDGGVQLQQLGEGAGDCAERSRTFGRVEAQQLALSHARGMASIVTKARRVVLLDLEEEADDEDEQGEEDGNDSDEREADAEGGSAKSDGSGDDMDEDDE